MAVPSNSILPVFIVMRKVENDATKKMHLI